MKTLLVVLLLVAAVIVPRAATYSQISGTITVTNPVVAGNVLAFGNFDTRVAVATVSFPAREFLLGASIGASTTNLYNHLNLYKPMGVTNVTLVGTNTITFITGAGYSFAVTNTANLGIVALATNTVAYEGQTVLTTSRQMFSSATVYTTNSTSFTTDYIWGWATNNLPTLTSGSGTLQYIQLINSTNAPVNISLFSAQTNIFVHNTAWTNSAAGPLNSLCAPIVIYATDYVKRGTNYCVGKTVSFPIRATGANREVISIITAGTPTGTFPQNLSTSALLNLSGISD
jgi:hypothetical protein